MIAHVVIATAALLLMPPCASQAQVGDSGQGFGAFRLLRARNIFDPERESERSEVSAPSIAVTASRPNFVALTGTMVTESKSLAFFMGSQPEHSKVVGVGEKVSDFTVLSITGAQVELEHSGKRTPLSIGQQLTLSGTITASTLPPVASPPAASSPAAEAAAPAPARSGDKNDVLRRMMERRQKENPK